jgi:hypothetical protein
MVGALQRRPSADHSRAGTSTASILAGPTVSRRRSSPRPRSPHCCRCCDEAPIAAVVVQAPFSLSSFSRSLSCSSSLSLSRALARVSSLPLPLLSLPLASVLYSCSFSLSPFSHARPPLARVLSFSLSVLRARASPLARVLSFSLSLTLAPSRSRRNAGSAHFTRCAMSRAANPVSPFRPSAGRPSASHRVRRATPCRFPDPRGITPPRWDQIGSTLRPSTPESLGSVPAVQGSACGVVTAPERGPVLQPLAKTPGDAQKRESAAERRRKGGERLGPAKVQGCGSRQ